MVDHGDFIMGIDPGRGDDCSVMGLWEQERLYESIAESFGGPAVVDINHCSLEEWAARVDALVREVI